MKAVSIFPILLAASFVSLGQNNNNLTERFKNSSIQKCGIVQSMQPDAASTCPGPPPPSGGGNWSFVQVGWWSNFGAQSGPGGGACYLWTLSCTANLAKPLTPGNLLIVLPLTYTGGTVATLTGIAEEGLSGICGGCQTKNTSVLQIGMGYILSAVGGESTVTCLFNAPSSGWMGCGYVEAHWSGSGGVSFDTGGQFTRACSTSCPGVNLSLKGTNDFVLQVDFPFNTDPLSPSPGWNFIQGSYAWCVTSSSTSCPTPTWFLPMSDPATTNNAIAFTGH